MCRNEWMVCSIPAQFHPRVCADEPVCWFVIVCLRRFFVVWGIFSFHDEMCENESVVCVGDGVCTHKEE